MLNRWKGIHMQSSIYNIAIATDKNYLKYTIVVMQSLFESNKDKIFCFYILYNELDEADIAILNDLTKRYNAMLMPLYIDGARYENFPTQKRLPVEAYFRLDLQRVLPSDVEKILYLDCDVLVCGDIAELYNLDIQDKYLAACGFGVDCKAGDEFNSGVLLMNLKKFREDITFETYREIAERLNGNFYMDQELLNIQFAESGTKYVEKYLYNFTAPFYRKFKKDILKKRTDFDLSEVVIIHFAGPGIRPWQIRIFEEDMKLLGKKNLLEVAAAKGYVIDRLFYEMQNMWWDIAQKTPIYDELKNDMQCNKSDFYAKMIDALAESKEYTIGYKLLRNIRNLYNGIRK